MAETEKPIGYLNDPREQAIRTDLGYVLEADNRNEKMYHWGAMVVDYCNYDEDELQSGLVPIFHTSEGGETATTYTITFNTPSGTLIKKVTVKEGKTPSAPTGYTEGGVSYKIVSWTPEIAAATADTTYTVKESTPITSEYIYFGLYPWIEGGTTDDDFSGYSKFTGESSLIDSEKKDFDENGQNTHTYIIPKVDERKIDDVTEEEQKEGAYDLVILFPNDKKFTSYEIKINDLSFSNFKDTNKTVTIDGSVYKVIAERSWEALNSWSYTTSEGTNTYNIILEK